jgi:CRISPR/Cas system-associated protein Csm6
MNEVTRLILVTVGRSVIERTLSYEPTTANNFLNSNSSAASIDRLERGEGGREQTKLEQEFFEAACRLDTVKICLEGLKRDIPNKHSAEVSSLHQMIKGHEHLGITPDNVKIVLVSTGSSDGVFAARINKRLIGHLLLGCPADKAKQWHSNRNDGLDKSLERISVGRVRGLQVKDVDQLIKTGVGNLRQLFHRFNEEYKQAQRFVNITGGFKGVIPLITAFAWADLWRLFYLYESTPDLVEIPYQDVKIDANNVGMSRPNEPYKDLIDIMSDRT